MLAIGATNDGTRVPGPVSGPVDIDALTDESVVVELTVEVDLDLASDGVRQLADLCNCRQSS